MGFRVEQVTERQRQRQSGTLLTWLKWVKSYTKQSKNTERKGDGYISEHPEVQPIYLLCMAADIPGCRDMKTDDGWDFECGQMDYSLLVQIKADMAADAV